MMINTRRILFCFLNLSASLQAGIELPAIFSDGRVIQRDMKVPVWGWSEKGERVVVTFDNKDYETSADGGGKWMVYLDAHPASADGKDINIKVGDETMVIQDVLVGDVWLCSGQSNMEYTLERISRPAKDSRKVSKVSRPVRRAALIGRAHLIDVVIAIRPAVLTFFIPDI